MKLDADNPRCRARWFFKDKRSALCSTAAFQEVDGIPLCWTHATTVLANMATLEQVLAGTRDPNLNYNPPKAAE